jgi:hypothetical protein
MILVGPETNNKTDGQPDQDAVGLHRSKQTVLDSPGVDKELLDVRTPNAIAAG